MSGLNLSLINQDAFEQKELTNIRNRVVGAIDIGTNSTHLVIAFVDIDLKTFTIELAEKSTTRLGERDSESGELTELGMNRVIEALKRFKELALSYNVEQLIVSATSAVREAPNGRAFLIRVQEELDLMVDLISGAEEARLIYLGVLSGMQFGDSPHFLIDIGGGSTELILADSKDARALTSTRVGAVRLQRDFIKDEPMHVRRQEFLKTFIQGSLEPAVDKVLRRVKPGETPIMVATSGTAMAIGALAANIDNINQSKIHGSKVSKASLDKIVDKLLKMTPNERYKISSISDRRSEIIVPGALILQAAMEMLGVNEIVLSERALREGLVVDWMLREGFLEDRFGLQASIRQRTVFHLAQRFGVNKFRVEKVASNALTIYENSQGILHNDKGQGRDLLWAAAMLHSCGQHINLSAYHKHSWYLIRNGELLGYSQAEHAMVAAIARYHRKSLPKKRHDAWQSLGSRDDKRLVSEMALILRLASAIDKRPKPIISKVIVTSSAKEFSVELVGESPSQNLELEKWSLKQCIPIVKEVAGKDLKVLIH